MLVPAGMLLMGFAGELANSGDGVYHLLWAGAAIAGVAIAQNHEANENRIIGKHSERDIPLAQVPEAAMNAARAQLASISKAEQVTRKATNGISTRTQSR